MLFLLERARTCTDLMLECRRRRRHHHQNRLWRNKDNGIEYYCECSDFGFYHSKCLNYNHTQHTLALADNLINSTIFPLLSKMTMLSLSFSRSLSPSMCRFSTCTVKMKMFMFLAYHKRYTLTLWLRKSLSPMLLLCEIVCKCLFLSLYGSMPRTTISICRVCITPCANAIQIFCCYLEASVQTAHIS